MNKKEALNLFIKNFTGNHNDDIYNYLDPASSLVAYDTKHILFIEEEKADYMYFLLKGNVKLSKITKDGKETIIRIVNPKEIFAEATLYGRNTYPVTATLLSKSVLLAINIASLKELCIKNPDFVLKLFASMSMQLRYLVDMVNDLSSQDTLIRLIKYLKSLSENKGSNTIKLPISKKNLAMLLGVAPETISRLLSKMQNDKIIEINGRDIKIICDLKKYI